jgi:hypothetical protein
MLLDVGSKADGVGSLLRRRFDEFADGLDQPADDLIVRMISMLTCTAVGLRRMPESMATPCSVKA